MGIPSVSQQSSSSCFFADTFLLINSLMKNRKIYILVKWNLKCASSGLFVCFWFFFCFCFFFVFVLLFEQACTWSLTSLFTSTLRRWPCLGGVIKIQVYNMDVIQRRFWLAAINAPYLDGTREKLQENVSKKKTTFLRKLLLNCKKKASHYLNGEGKHWQLGEDNRFWTDIRAGPWCGRSISTFSKQAKQRIYTTNETFHLFLQRRNACNLSKTTFGENKKNNKQVCDISMKVDYMEYLNIMFTSISFVFQTPLITNLPH